MDLNFKWVELLGTDAILLMTKVMHTLPGTRPLLEFQKGLKGETPSLQLRLRRKRNESWAKTFQSFKGRRQKRANSKATIIFYIEVRVKFRWTAQSTTQYY